MKRRSNFEIADTKIIRMVRLGSERAANEGLRIGTVRRPPRGVPKAEFSSGNWYDVWFPNLAPSAEIVKLALRAGSRQEWAALVKRYRAEMAHPEKAAGCSICWRLFRIRRISRRAAIAKTRYAATGPFSASCCSIGAPKSYDSRPWWLNKCR
jgi:uncharacterized protein YeaO (DUF488 family)